MPARAIIKRVLRRTTRVVLISLAALVIYFAYYLSLHWLWGRNIVPDDAINLVRTTVFYPIDWFASSSFPTSPYIRATAEWCYTQGNGKEFRWSDLFDYWEGARTGNPIPPPQPRTAPTTAG